MRDDENDEDGQTGLRPSVVEGNERIHLVRMARDLEDASKDQ